MKSIVSFALSCAVVLGVALSSPVVSFGCGGAGQTGCKIASLPLSVDGLVMIVRWLEIVIP